MPWKVGSTMSLREEFVLLAQDERANIRELCRRFEISWRIGHKWLARFRQGGPEALADRSRRPHVSPMQTPEAIERLIVDVRREHPAWGARKIRALLLARGTRSLPAVSVVHRILVRQGLIDSERWRQNTAVLRFEYPHANDLLQMDFKGHFAMRSGRRCHPLCVLDDRSRYALGIWACGNERSTTVRACLTGMFRRYGMPLGMLMDNGSAWSRETELGVWLMRLGMRVLHGRVRHPQTQGKLERFNRTLGVEALAGREFDDLGDCQKRFDFWRDVYNLQRPHESLGMQAPASRYSPSSRPFPETLPPIEYGPDDQVASVNTWGWIKHGKSRIRVGIAFAGLPVAVRPTVHDGVYNVYFCHQKIHEINLYEQKNAQ